MPGRTTRKTSSIIALVVTVGLAIGLGILYSKLDRADQSTAVGAADDFATSAAPAVEAAPLASEPRRVLVLHSFPHAFSPWSDMAAYFREELTRQWPEHIDFYQLSLDPDWIREGDEEGHFVDYVGALFARRDIDLIVAVGTPATLFIRRHRPDFFPSTPIVALAADLRPLPDGDAAGEVQVNMFLDLSQFAANIFRLLPDTRNVLAIVGSSRVERRWRNDIERASQAVADRANFIWTTDMSLDGVLSLVAGLPADSAVLYLVFSVDANGTPFEEDYVLDEIGRVAEVPVFGSGQQQLGRGVIGGPLYPSRTIGYDAAHIAARILNGENAADIGYEPIGFGTPSFDWRELEKWGIDRQRLPPDSDIQFREPPIWFQYRGEIVLAATILLVQTALIIGLLHQRRMRRSAEADRRHHLLQLERMNRRAAAGELSASLAHEVKQPVTSITCDAEAGLNLLRQQHPDLEEVSKILQAVVSDAKRANTVIDTVRSLFRHEAGERSLEDVNSLAAEVIDVVRAELQDHRVSLTLALADAVPTVRVNRVQVQQLMLNLILNAIEAMDDIHDRPRTLRIETASTNDEVSVTLTDSGPGLDAEDLERIFDPFVTTKVKGIGMGLTICRSIAEAHAGRLTATRAEPFGMRFAVNLPAAQTA